MTSYEIDYIRFERQPQSEQISLTFTPKMEEIFETLETADIDMNPSHSIIEPIVNRNVGNPFRHQNRPNQHQHTHKNTSQHYQHRNTRQQYQHRNTSQNFQRRNTSQQYQPISYQRPSTSSILYLKENCIGCGLNNKGVR